MHLSPAPAKTFAHLVSRASSNGGNQGAGAGAGPAITRRRRSRYNPEPMASPQPGSRDTPRPELFREVFGRFATGVAVITSTGATGAGGMTANALCSLSLEPLLVLVCLANSARTLPIVRETQRFAVNLLAADQRTLAGLFASKAPEHEKLSQVEHRLVAGMPVINGTIAWAVCDVRELLPGGDHTIAIGEVGSMGLGQGKPLLWFEGRYHRLPEN
jgi:flavin reductase (DIM6/NTAB) family NADH-FMN oxidoreductase RutF